MRIGFSKAALIIATPFASSPTAEIFIVFKSNSCAALNSATPPPGTMPSSIAALVAARASSIRYFFSFNSVSVVAPTLITATPPESFARRSCNFSLSKSEVVCSIWSRICLILFSISVFEPAPPTIVVLSFVAMTFLASPSMVKSAFSSFLPSSSEITSPPVTAAMSASISFLLSPNPGALIAKALNVPRILLTTNVARASPSTSSAIMTSSFLPLLATFSKTGRMSFNEEIFWSVIKM